MPTPCATCFHLMYVTEAIEFISTQSLRNSCYLVSFTVCNRTKTAPSFVYNSHEGAVFKLVHKPLNCEFVFSTCDLQFPRVSFVMKALKFQSQSPQFAYTDFHVHVTLKWLCPSFALSLPSSVTPVVKCSILETAAGYPRQLSQEVITGAAILIRVLGYNLKPGWPGATKQQLAIRSFTRCAIATERDHLGRAQRDSAGQRPR